MVRGDLKTYAALRRRSFGSPGAVAEAFERSKGALDWREDDARWVRSYVLAESHGSVGTICVYEATSPEAVRAHAVRAGLPVDEIAAVAETLVVEPDPVEPLT